MYEYEGSDEDEDDTNAVAKAAAAAAVAMSAAGGGAGVGSRPQSSQIANAPYRPSLSDKQFGRIPAGRPGSDLIPPNPPITGGFNVRVAPPVNGSQPSSRMHPRGEPPSVLPAAHNKGPNLKLSRVDDEHVSATVAPNETGENTLRQNFARLQASYPH